MVMENNQSIRSVVKRSGAVVPFNQERITNAIYRAAVAVGGRDRSTAEKLSEQVVQILEETTPDGYIPTVEEIQDLVEKVLIENGHARVAKAYILYREERSRRRKDRADRASHPSGNIPWAKIWHILDWSVAHGVHTVGSYNQRVRNGEIREIVSSAEAFYEADVERAVENIIECCQELKLVVITGPSSSGKTTTTIKVGQRLARFGINLVTLNVDNYFFDLELHPKDEFGDYDFETPQALDLPLINQHLHQLIDGQEVMIPFYDFKTGQRSEGQTHMKLGSDEILVVDSLHGMYPAMTEGIPQDRQFKLYLEPLLQMKAPDGKYIRWTDLRLMRRMLRDASHRAYDPQKTLLHWHYVRSSELRNIIPYIGTANDIINTGMPYELSIFKPKLYDQFSDWIERYSDDPLREDAHQRASRVYQLLKTIEAVENDSIVPVDSVLREFIGGSVYEY